LGLLFVFSEAVLSVHIELNVTVFIPALLSDYDSQKKLHPFKGDLVYLELELENKDSQNHHNLGPPPSSKQRRIVPIFAYVKHVIKDAVTGTTIVHKEICE
jgi:hypothetical protein